ncbi:hypothetical protein MRX96_019469 [Rhipicephalus microplus]
MPRAVGARAPSPQPLGPPDEKEYVRVRQRFVGGRKVQCVPFTTPRNRSCVPLGRKGACIEPKPSVVWLQVQNRGQWKLACTIAVPVCSPVLLASSIRKRALVVNSPAH